MSRRVLCISLFIALLASFAFFTSVGCSNGDEFGTPLYISPGQDPNALPDRYVVSIRVQPDGVNIAIGGLQQFRAWGNFNDGTLEDITAMVEWYTETPAIGTFEATGGRFLAQHAGVGIVRCRYYQGDGYVTSTAGYVNSFNPDQDLPPAVPLNPSVEPTDEGVLVYWDMNTTDGDMAGYNIWRTQVSAAHYATDYGRINEKPWLYPPYLDQTVVSGWYFYRVTAEDLIGLNSAPSEEVAVFVTGTSHYGSAYDGVTSSAEENEFYGHDFSSAL